MVTAIPTSTSTVRARAEIRELTAAIGQNSLPRPPHPRPSRALSRLSIRPPLRLTYVTATVTRRHERSRSQLRQIHLDPIDFSVKSTRHLPLTSPLDTPLNATPHHSVDAVQRIRRISTDRRARRLRDKCQLPRASAMRTHSDLPSSLERNDAIRYDRVTAKIKLYGEIGRSR